MHLNNHAQPIGSQLMLAPTLAAMMKSFSVRPLAAWVVISATCKQDRAPQGEWGKDQDAAGSKPQHALGRGVCNTAV